MKISTSILNAFDRKEAVNKLNKTPTSYIHIDVMDGLFVKDTQFNKLEEIYEISKISKYPLDIHLMVENPINYIEKLDNLNIEYITFHIEVEKNIHEIISLIKKKGYKVGLSIKPNTNINKLIPYLDYIDLILIMSVEPGKGGQKFISQTSNRIKYLKKIIHSQKNNIKIEVDGGLNNETISKIKQSDIAVVGTYIINSNNYTNQIEKLLKESQ